jgi:hypothetical protein
MGFVVGVGWPSPLGGPDQGWDVTPLVAGIAGILIWRFGLRREVTPAAAGGAVIFGLVVATAADAWGLLPTLAVATLIACLTLWRSPRRRPR